MSAGDRLLGYGVIRPCGAGFKVGPLIADEQDLARRILDALAARAEGQPVYLDVPDNHAAAVALAESWGMQEVFACARMYRGAPPPLPIERIFGITTLEPG